MLIFATNNLNKVKEIRSMLTGGMDIITMLEAGIDIDILEPHSTLEENALEKSSVIKKITGQDCFSEDTGLFVDALNGEPGVKSARYAGEPANDKNNIAHLLINLADIPQRNAHFKTVISLLMNDKQYFFEGICEGRIISHPVGDNGFGYDPVFIPDGADKTFAEMDLEEKNKYSHRKKATRQLINFLNEHYGAA